MLTHRELILPGTLSHKLFDRDNITRCYLSPDSDNPDERAAYRLTIDQWRAEYAKARMALAEQIGARAGRDFADSLEYRHLRHMRSSGAAIRLNACDRAPRYGIICFASNPLRDSAAYLAYIESFAAALIDVADDVRYERIAA